MQFDGNATRKNHVVRHHLGNYVSDGLPGGWLFLFCSCLLLCCMSVVMLWLLLCCGFCCYVVMIVGVMFVIVSVVA